MLKLRLTGVVVLSALIALGTAAPAFIKIPVAPPISGGLPSTFRVEVVARNLTVPWAIGFLPDGRLIFTERPGRVSVLDPHAPIPVAPTQLTGVPAIPSGLSEGGLLGLAVHPNFATNGWVYLMYTRLTGAGLRNRIERFRLDGTALVDATVIVDDIPGASGHDGGRIRFGPDRLLYISTGDAGVPNSAQDLNALSGKILRVRDDGSIPFDNPFGSNSAVWSLGHRNPQGFDWDPVSGTLYETEHGPSGNDAPGGGDEINIIDAGHNYGWPIIHHTMTAPGLESPRLEYTPAIAPSGASFYRGTRLTIWRNNFFFATLRGTDIHRLVLSSTNRRVIVSDSPLFRGAFGRIRDVVSGPDGALYFSTSNRDGRGIPAADDDRILRIVPIGTTGPPPPGSPPVRK